jgi:aminoacrylate hydrolase
VNEKGLADGIFYETLEGPSKDAPAVVLSAGLGGSGQFFKPQFGALVKRFRVVLYDHRGTGKSARELSKPHSVDAMADDILCVLDALKLKHAHVVGHAAGALAGLALALKAAKRIDKLVLINAWAKPDPHIRRCFETRIALLTGSGRRAYVRAQPIFLYPAAWISDNIARLEQEEAHHLRAMPRNEVVLARINALLAFDIDAKLRQIKIPTLVSASADDMLVPVSCSKHLAAGLRNAVLDIAPWGGHSFTVTAPERFNASLVAFLRGEKEGKKGQ